MAKGCFNFEAISGYVDAVRARVELEGYGEFAKIETDQVFGQFSVENTIKKSESTAKTQSIFKAGVAKANGICFCYNLSNNLTMATTSRRNHSFSWGEVQWGNRFSEVNPCNMYNSLDILIVEGLVNDPVGSDI